MTRLPSRSFPRPQMRELESRLGVARASPSDLRPVEQLVMAPVHRQPDSILERADKGPIPRRSEAAALSAQPPCGRA